MQGKAITDNMYLPKSSAYLLFLNTKDKTECIVLNKGKGKPIELDWEHRSGYMKAKYPEIRNSLVLNGSTITYIC